MSLIFRNFWQNIVDKISKLNEIAFFVKRLTIDFLQLFCEIVKSAELGTCL